jgi:hypothetical protein
VKECKKKLENTETNGDKQKFLRTYKDWAFRNKVKALAGSFELVCSSLLNEFFCSNLATMLLTMVY